MNQTHAFNDAIQVVLDHHKRCVPYYHSQRATFLKDYGNAFQYIKQTTYKHAVFTGNRKLVDLDMEIFARHHEDGFCVISTNMAYFPNNPHAFPILSRIIPIRFNQDGQPWATMVLANPAPKRMGEHPEHFYYNAHTKKRYDLLPNGEIAMTKDLHISDKKHHRTIANLLNCGYQNNEIAIEIDESLSNAKNHLQEIWTKLDVRNRFEYVVKQFLFCLH